MPLVSTLPKRTKPVTEEDFVATPQISSLNADSINLELIENWNRYIFFTPQQVAAIFGDQFQKGFRLSIELTYPSVFEMILGHPDIGQHKQTYDLNLGQVKESEIQLNSDVQSKVIGRDITMRFIELDVMLGVGSVLFEASSSMGAYVWSRMGYELDFRSDIENNRREREMLSQRLFGRLEALSEFLLPNVYNTAIVYARLCNPDDLFHLTHIEDDLSVLLNNLDAKTLIDLLPDENVPYRHNVVSRIGQVISHCAANSKPLKVGHLLLAGEFWKGRADYDNDVQVQRIADYGGGFKYAEIVPAAADLTPARRSAMWLPPTHSNF